MPFPINCFKSALSTNAKSIDSEIFDVDNINTFLNDFNWSICVNKAFTARIESDGSLPFNAAFRADANDSTSSINTNINDSWYWHKSRICLNNFIINLPDSLNHFENNEWAFISINENDSYLSDNRMDNFCANDLHKDVLPVPISQTIQFIDNKTMN